MIINPDPGKSGAELNKNSMWINSLKAAIRNLTDQFSGTFNWLKKAKYSPIKAIQN